MDFEGTVEGGGPEDFTGAKVSFSAQVASVSSGAEGRDNHLKKEDFFDAENHPTISFVSKSFVKTGENTYKVIGDMTMKGNTKEIEISAIHIGSTQTRSKKNKVGFQLKGSLDRNEFGVSGAAGSVAPIIEIICNVEMIEQTEE
jgi:polyisoprenoid-binding protein YceI